jgi:anti-sigma factor RsiW
MPNFTTEDLMQYVYHETSKEQTMAIEKAIQTDWALKEKVMALRDSMHTLDSMLESPRSQSVMAILNYARTSAEVEQH